ncbi:MAG: hypothetical protein QW098_03230 [Candidatus Hadarchaeales archaeon]
MRERVRKRYLILELGGKASGNSLQTLLEGEPSLDRTHLKLLPLSSDLALLRCGHLQVEKLRALLSLRGIRVLGVSGTMKGARRFLARKGYSAS